MSLVIGRFDWESKMDAIIQNEYGLSGERVNITVQKARNIERSPYPFVLNESSGYYCTLIGYLNNFEKLQCAHGERNITQSEMISLLYNSGNLNRFSELDGLFIIVILDTKKHKCFIIQMRPGFSLPVYYTDIGNGFVFSTSLKELLPNIGNGRKLNDSSVLDFLHFGYMIPNEATLICGVNKLVPGSYIEVDYSHCSYTVKRIIPNKQRNTISRKVAKERLLYSISTTVQDLSAQLKTDNVALTLTAGWDCNLLLHFLRSGKKGHITAATIKGGISHNEIPQASAILKNHYKNVNHVTGTVESNSIDMLPELVWRYEGYLFQEGMFLRHALAKSLSTANCNVVFLGVGADQILFPETSLKELLRQVKNHRNPEWSFRRSFRGSCMKGDYIMLIDYNIKMHEIMLNSFGIQGFYPFVNSKTSNLSSALGIFNNWRKKYYKQKVTDLLGKSIIQHISKSGATVDTEDLFLKKKELLMKIIESSFVERFLTTSQINTIKKDPLTFHQVIIQLVYIFLFNELFISGRFDTKFNRTNIGRKLHDFLIGGAFVPTY